MTHHHLAFVLQPDRAALPRVVSALHARGLHVEHLRVEGAVGCAEVRGDVEAERIRQVLLRLVDVREVRRAGACVHRAVTTLPTRCLVVHQQTGQAPRARAS